MQKNKVAAELERAIQRLQDLRFEVGAQVVWLADRTGQVLAEAGMIMPTITMNTHNPFESLCFMFFDPYQ